MDWHKISKIQVKLDSMIFLALSALSSIPQPRRNYDSRTGVKNLALKWPHSVPVLWPNFSSDLTFMILWEDLFCLHKSHSNLKGISLLLVIPLNKLI